VPSSTYLVTSLADTNTPGTLRFAITQANAIGTGTAASPDQIQIMTGGGTIAVIGASLPALTDIAVIDATTATGHGVTPIITLDGALAGVAANGLTISAASSTVKGFDIVNFSGNGLRLDGGGTTIVNDYIGITTTGSIAANGGNGIFISGSAGNVIGGTGATDANVISGNGGDGILINGLSATDNLVVANFIGTNSTGTVALGNAGNGIEITNGARLNTIGGNTPTATAFTGKPVDGNLISGNGENGVLLTTGAGFNTLSGNFIGTDLAGTAALGNVLDGVAIVNGANNNSLIGTTFPQPPFVFLNLMSGNGGNGLRIQDSNNTTVKANTFGLGDDNATAVPNHLDGVLIAGSSANTQFGGVIPLGNIVAGNGQNGVEIRDTASGTVCFNTFCGLPAFVDTAVGNALDGFLITSTGGNNLLRTNVISGNVGNGVHISGNATGVEVEEDIIGMDTNGALRLPNGANGVLIDGNAHDNSIGGLQVSVILQNTISANGGNGIAIIGNASNNQVFHSDIGTDILGANPFGNAGAGVFVGGNAQGSTIGGTGAFHQNVISGNLGDGIRIGDTSQGTHVIGNLIGTARNGIDALANLGSGVSIVTSNNLVGGTAAGTGNVIAFNAQNGVSVAIGTGDGILGNSIFGNVGLGISLTGGGNLLQPAPVLTAASLLTANTIRVTGVLPGAAKATYRVEFFASSSSTAPGQGKTFLGFVSVTAATAGALPFSFSSTLPPTAGTSITATATDAANDTSTFSAAITASSPITAVGAGAGGGPEVKVYNANGSLRFDFFAFAQTFTGGVRVAVSDVNGDGAPDIVAAAGPGGGPNVKVFDGVTGTLIANFYAFDPTFTGGVYVAVADANGDGHADVTVGAGAGGGPNVKVIDGTKLGMVQANGEIAAGALLQNFYAYGSTFTGGVTVAAGDVNGDGKADVITGAGPGGGPHVKVFDGATGGVLDSFFAYASTFQGGVYVSAGDVNGDGRADIFTGAGAGGGPQVKVFNGLNLDVIDSFYAFNPSFKGGVLVGAADVNGDGLADIIVGAGAGGGPQVNILNGANLNLLQSFYAFDPTFKGGVYVG
jgi:hypothetical protein